MSNDLAKRWVSVSKQRSCWLEGSGSKQSLQNPDWAQKNVVYKGKLDHMVGLMVLQSFDPFVYQVDARGVGKWRPVSQNAWRDQTGGLHEGHSLTYAESHKKQSKDGSIKRCAKG